MDFLAGNPYCTSNRHQSTKLCGFQGSEEWCRWTSTHWINSKIYYLKPVKYLINKLTIVSGINLSITVWKLIREANSDAFTVGIADFRSNLKSQIELPIHRRRFSCCCCLIWVDAQAGEINPTFVINFPHFDNHFIAHRYFIFNFANAVVS